MLGKKQSLLSLLCLKFDFSKHAKMSGNNTANQGSYCPVPGQGEAYQNKNLCLSINEKHPICVTQFRFTEL